MAQTLHSSLSPALDSTYAPLAYGNRVNFRRGF